MACGCLTKCDCRLLGDLGITIMGSGESGDPYVISAPAETVFAAGPLDDSVDIVAGGPYGHSPQIGVRIDPAGTATPTLSGAGLRFDCCGGGSVNYSTSLIATDYSVNLATDYALFVDSSGGHVDITLPAIHANGDTVQISDISATFDVTIDTADAALINGFATYTMSNAYESVTLMMFNTNWYVV